MHEDYKRHSAVVLSSDRTFGLVWTAVLLIYAVAPIRHGAHIRAMPLLAAGGLALLSTVAPSLLHYPNRVSGGLATVLHRVMNPIVMAILFFGVFMPAGFLYRIRGKDAMGRLRDPNASSYWIRRSPTAPSPDSMTNQF